MLIRAIGLILCFAFIESKGRDILPDSLDSFVDRFGKDTLAVIELNKIAGDYMNVNPATARKIANYTATLSRQISFNRGYARSLTVLGNSYWHEGLFEFAQNYYLLAARQYEELNDLGGLGRVYNNLGEVHKALGLYDVALRYLKKSAELKGKDSTHAVTLHNIAELYIIKRDFDEAEKYLQESMDVAMSLQDVRSVYYNYWSAGKIKVEKGLYKDGIANYNKAVTGWKSLSEQRSLAQTYLDLSEAFRKQGNVNNSQFYVNEVFNILRKIKITDLKVKAFLELSKIDSARGDYAKSLVNLNRHLLLKDSVYNLLKTEQVNRLQVLYETERRERENEQLRIEKSLKEKELQAREGILKATILSFVMLAIFSVILYRQRLKILKNHTVLFAKNEEIKSQKESLELQAVALMKLNEELGNLNKTLEKRIEERSTQLMIQNQKLAEYSFVNAHKLRAPVASILGLIQLMKQAPPGEREEIVSHLKTCSEQLDAVIQEIGRTLELD